MADISILQLAVIAIGGLIAGVINGTVGGGSLLTYPLLVAMGLSPVIGAATNTTGLATGNAAALIPHRNGQTVEFKPWWRHGITTAAGALLGGSLLILLPEKVFEFIVPILLIGASLTMLFRPTRGADRPIRQIHTLSRLFAAGIYNGYFGPGQGVLAMAVLLRDGRLSVHQVIVIKNLVIAFSNVVVATLFIITGHVLWSVALTLMVFVGLGGWLGGHMARFMHPQLARYLVAGVGLFSAAWFLLRR